MYALKENLSQNKISFLSFYERLCLTTGFFKSDCQSKVGIYNINLKLAFFFLVDSVVEILVSYFFLVESVFPLFFS